MKILIFYSQISVSTIATYCSTIVFCFSLLCLLFLWAKMVSFSFSTLFSQLCLFVSPFLSLWLTLVSLILSVPLLAEACFNEGVSLILWIFFGYFFSTVFLGIFSSPSLFPTPFSSYFLWRDRRDMVVCGSVFMGFRRGLQWWDRRGYGDGFGRGFLCICYLWWSRVSVVVGMGNWWWWWLMWVRGAVVVVGRGQWAWWWLMWVCLVIF